VRRNREIGEPSYIVPSNTCEERRKGEGEGGEKERQCQKTGPTRTETKTSEEKRVEEGRGSRTCSKGVTTEGKG
jgi:hypothetical protein